jgi:hypothetical protein
MNYIDKDVNRENINKTMKLYKKYYYTLQNKHKFKYEIIPEFYKNCYSK